MNAQKTAISLFIAKFGKVATVITKSVIKKYCPEFKGNWHNLVISLLSDEVVATDTGVVHTVEEEFDFRQRIYGEIARVSAEYGLDKLDRGFIFYSYENRDYDYNHSKRHLRAKRYPTLLEAVQVALADDDWLAATPPPPVKKIDLIQYDYIAE